MDIQENINWIVVILVIVNPPVNITWFLTLLKGNTPGLFILVRVQAQHLQGLPMDMAVVGQIHILVLVIVLLSVADVTLKQLGD